MRQLLRVLRDGDSATGDVEGGRESSAHGPAPTLHDVESLAARVRVAGMPVTVTVRGQRPDIPPGVDLAAYRVVQEALTNCLRHSAASRATVLITYDATQVEIEVVDDGRPPKVAAADAAAPAAPSTGHGIAGMRERVAIYGGELFAGPDAEGGFRVRARLPLARVAEVMTS